MKSLTTKAVILCAGQGTRTGLAYNKILHYFGGLTCLEHCINAFRSAGIEDILLVITPGDEEKIRSLTSLPFCYGGATRTESVLNALNSISQCDIVVIHDGARPFVTPEIIAASVKSAAEYGSGVAALEATDTVKLASNGTVYSHLKRSDTFLIQTPQAFDFLTLKSAYGSAEKNFTDDSEVYALSGKEVRLVPGSYVNKKITRPEDLFQLPRNARAGIGFDLHIAENGNGIVLGGVKIPCKMRLVGHSDADCLTHAIIDALLSAALKPDIGVLFPDTDDRYLGIESLKLLKETVDMISEKIQSISCVIIAQQPKLAPFISDMREKLAATMGITVDRINISATTTEHRGIIGDGKAIAASAFALLSD